MLVGLKPGTLEANKVSLLKNPDKIAKIYINGQWLDADTANTFEVRNPATGELIAKVADAGQIETKRAIAASKVTFLKL